MKITIPLFLLIISLKVRSQEKESFFFFDADWKPAKIQSGYYMVHAHVVNDSCWQWDFYNSMGPLIKTEQYSGKDAKVLNGFCYYYDHNGFVDSMTTYRRGKKNGDSWHIRRDSTKIRMKYKFLEDSLVEVIDITMKKKDTSAAYPDEKQSEYPGGQKGWARYLKEKFKYPERAMNNIIQGQVDVRFEVDKDGYVTNAYISRSVEYSIDEEALNIIENSGKWEPAFQNGRHVKSYKNQPIVFRLK
jgi:periplasmic protein TonB